jgi:hypothetical protein
VEIQDFLDKKYSYFEALPSTLGNMSDVSASKGSS